MRKGLKKILEQHWVNGSVRIVLLEVSIRSSSGYGDEEWYEVWLTGSPPKLEYFGDADLLAREIFNNAVKDYPVSQFDDHFRS